MQDLKKHIRDVPNFPKAGIMFRDITPLLANGPAWRDTVGYIAERYRNRVDIILGVESRGFLIGSAVAYELGVPVEVIRAGLAGFGGVKRRFTKTGEWNGVTIFDDYGHHPVEISAVLRAARASTKGQVIAIVQPHRYTRLQSLFAEFSSCFNDADTVIVADTYSAGEAPIPGADRDGLVAGVKAHGHRHVIALEKPEAIAGHVAGIAKPGDYVIFLGAGNITQWAYALPDELGGIKA